MKQELRETQIRYRQWFAASPEAVYDILCTSEGLDKWFCTGSVVDLGAMRCQYRWVNWGPDRKTHETDGPILAAERGKRFVFQWGARPATTIEFEFKADSGGTRVNVLEYGYDESDRDSKALMLQCASGWGEALAIAKFCLEQGVHYKHSWPKPSGGK